jgi:uncharacterized protein YndB with AHSA1/START domain
VETDRWYPADPETVWEEMVDPGNLADWFGGRGVAIDEVVPAERIAWTWEGEGDDPCSEVVVTLEPEGGGTRVHVVERAVEPVRTVPTGFQGPALARAVAE